MEVSLWLTKSIWWEDRGAWLESGAGAGRFPEGPAFGDSIHAYLCDPTGKTRKGEDGWSTSRATLSYRKRLHFGEWMNHE